MNVVIFGATGMVGQGVVKECLRDPEIEKILVIGRQAAGVNHPKVQEIVRADLLNLSPLKNELAGLDACFFCLGVSALGMNETDYRKVTYDLAVAAARALLAASPGITFEYISGQGTDSSAKGRVMWARVKGETENALLQMPFKAAYMFRPGMIIPLDGVRSKTQWYRLIYGALQPLLPLLERIAPQM
jgi:uncharacterized protein YbjT (DUF2867 family)